MAITYSTIYSEGLQDSEVSAQFENALSSLRNDPTQDCSHWIGDERVTGGPWIERTDPARAGVVVSRCNVAGPDIVNRAVDTARAAWPSWRRTPIGDRVAIMRRAAKLFRRDRIALAALVSMETGKTRADALAEVDECAAILDLNVDQLTSNDAFRVTMVAPSDNSDAYVELRPYGVFGVIAPFNFPFAIPLGMAAAALVMGNSVVLKPSSLTPACGQALVRTLFAAGVPHGVLNLVYGSGDTGRALTSSTIDGMAFTGSAGVGLAMFAQLVRPPHSRPLIAEMGGKNPAIVTKHADDLDVAATAVARSAFGMSGQKCNACSRVVVTDDVYDEFLPKLVDAVERMTVGDPAEPTSFTGPVISEAALADFDRIVAAARADGRVVVGGGSERHVGSYAELTVVADLPAGHRLTRDEHFLPILTVTRVADFDAAIREANDVQFGLSAGIFSNDTAERARFLDEIEAGIVFVNNPGGATTGVWPGGQTMSGWKASGSTGKGGFGPWYLHQFAHEQSRTVFE
ncbi:aldehyde dehydrogenase family protein [Mycolicibacterium sp. YH-1]|uniref:aldehyde dehydrogenase family protein n=1 Tax=Mycolicibacterium sp. YH-1 TaxID=2908837 RepID=UPI001F4C16C5|nr:aldehyde dehydrogenase family protein [Mycolicibacterium sp. YH-1]UNB53139.1 aldehyde dehydrogenase family protein [Mycolicibacterium sp. YH-1]